MNRAHPVWTTSKTLRLALEYADHPDREALAKSLGVTLTAMRKKVQELGVKRSPEARAAAGKEAGKRRTAEAAERRRKEAEVGAKQAAAWDYGPIRRYRVASADASIPAIVAAQPELVRAWGGV